MVCDFEDEVINDIYNMNPDYHTKEIHIAVFPLEQESIIMRFLTCLARNFVCHKIKYYRNLLTANYLNIVLLFSFCQILQLRMNQNRQVSAETCRF